MADAEKVKLSTIIENDLFVREEGKDKFVYKLLKIDGENLKTKKIINEKDLITEEQKQKVIDVNLTLKNVKDEIVYKLPDDAAKNIKEKFNL